MANDVKRALTSGQDAEPGSLEGSAVRLLLSMEARNLFKVGCLDSIQTLHAAVLWRF